jgi:hypothetical protein
MRHRWIRWALALVVALLLIALGWGASQPWTANHFGYALAGRDGLPAYLYSNGRRYHSIQVCAGAAWCQANRHQGVPRCWTQADLSGRGEWPLATVGTMFTLFGGQRTLLRTGGSQHSNAPFIIADGPDCYVEYSLEGGP